MLNLIKKINMESIYNRIDDYAKTQEEENKIERLCVSIEKSSEFRNLFFFCDSDNNDYFYESKDEFIMKEFLEKAISPYSIENISFVDYRTELLDNCDSDNTIELSTLGANIEIQEQRLYESLHDEFLNEETYIQRLVNAKDFYKELNVIKKECLRYLFDMALDEARGNIDSYEF